MPHIKPVRVIDISRKLKISTSSVIDILRQNGYPVEKSHHTPIIPEILSEIIKILRSDADKEIWNSLQSECSLWAESNIEAREELQEAYLKKQQKIVRKRERERKIAENREKSIKRQQKEKEFKDKLKVEDIAYEGLRIVKDGKIPVDHLYLEIIRGALALPQPDKEAFLAFINELK